MILIDNTRESLRKTGIFLACVLCLVAPAYYLDLITVNAVNAPVWDDYDSLVDFLNDFTETNSMAGRLALVLTQHNEHSLAFLRLAAVSVFFLKGDLDFKWLCYIGNAALVLIAYFLFLAFKTGGEFKVFYFSPALFFFPVCSFDYRCKCTIPFMERRGIFIESGDERGLRFSGKYIEIKK